MLVLSSRRQIHPAAGDPTGQICCSYDEDGGSLLARWSSPLIKMSADLWIFLFLCLHWAVEVPAELFLSQLLPCSHPGLCVTSVLVHQVSTAASRWKFLRTTNGPSVTSPWLIDWLCMITLPASWIKTKKPPSPRARTTCTSIGCPNYREVQGFKCAHAPDVRQEVNVPPSFVFLQRWQTRRIPEDSNCDF